MIKFEQLKEKYSSTSGKYILTPHLADLHVQHLGLVHAGDMGTVVAEHARREKVANEASNKGK